MSEVGRTTRLRSEQDCGVTVIRSVGGRSRPPARFRAGWAVYVVLFLAAVGAGHSLTALPQHRPNPGAAEAMAKLYVIRELEAPLNTRFYGVEVKQKGDQDFVVTGKALPPGARAARWRCFLRGSGDGFYRPLELSVKR